MDNRKEVLYSDLPALAEDPAQFSTVRVLDKWEAVPYKTAKCSGTMLYAAPAVTPDDLTLHLNLTGWYKIYLCLATSKELGRNRFLFRLTKDAASAQVWAEPGIGLQEVYWRSTDLTDQDLHISLFSPVRPLPSELVWLRFVPMEEEEVAAFQADQSRTDTKRIYATHDMHGQLYHYDPKNPDEWRCLVENYRDSDVQSLSMENLFIFDGEAATGDANTLAYTRDGDFNVQKSLKHQFTYEMLEDLIDYGHRELGIEMILSLRMAAWGIEFPYDQMYFDNTFLRKHLDLRCVDRMGHPVEAASYTYPETRQYILDQFSDMAATSCDGVEMIFNRVTALVLFEQPFLDRFAAKYPSIDPRELPAADHRIYTIRCEIMTEFVTALRERLDRERAARGQKRIQLIVRGHATLHNNKLLGLDLEDWAKRGLIDKVVVYPMLIDEDLSGDIWQDEAHTKIDLAKYEAFAYESERSVIRRRGDFEYPHVDILPAYDGEGDPATDEERIAQWASLTEQYGVPVYHDILPRHMTTAEYQRRATDLYQRGAEYLSLWDTYNRVPMRAQWTMAGRLGHKEELAGFADGAGELFTRHRLLSVGGQNVSMYHPAWGG